MSLEGLKNLGSGKVLILLNKVQRFLNTKQGLRTSFGKNEKKLFKVDTSTPKCEGSDFKSWNNCNGTHTTSDGFKYTGLFINGKIFAQKSGKILSGLRT